MLIQQIVQYNNRIAGLNDVQLGWYPDSPYNADLAERYQFTAHAEPGRKSSVEVLEIVQDAFVRPTDSRFVVQATYGHGKTHFALALANFFGKPTDSPEVTHILANIRHAAGEAKEKAIAAHKQNHGSFLVVRLDGTVPASLPAQFLTALTTALHENAATQKTQLPFWSERAQAFLDRLAGDVLRNANAFLSTHQKDVPALLAEVKTSDPFAHDLCRSLSTHLYGTPLDFGGEVDLKFAVEYAVDTFCGAGKPFAGMLVLFDEFAVFIHEYATHTRRGNRAALQKLLDGINNRPGNAAFVAFTQFDVLETAERAYKKSVRDVVDESELSGFEDLKKELTRLKQENRFRLHSSLEMVLESYLSQDKNGLAQIRTQAADAFDKAADLTVQMLPARYDGRNGWGTEKVDEHLTEGCFPLHPVTTGLLCTLQLQQGTVTRSVLGFAKNAMDKRAEQSALLTDARGVSTPNWVYAAELVDWFGDQITGDLTGEAYNQYRAALQNAGAGLPSVQEDTLKAILLQTVARIAPTGQDDRAYARLVAALTGHSEADCDAALRELAARLIIDRDPQKPLYRFFSGNTGSHIGNLETKIRRIVENATIDPNLIPRLNEQWQKQGVKPVPAPAAAVPAANCDDYAAERYILPYALCTAQELRRLTKAVTWTGGCKLRRGIVIYAWAQNADEVQQLQAKADDLLREAFGTALTIPVLLAVPTEPRPRFAEQVLKELALQTMTLQEQKEFGSEAVQAARAKYQEAVKGELASLLSSVEFHVPPVFRAALPTGGAHLPSEVRLKKTLEICYKQAYPDLVPAFKCNHRVGETKLRGDVRSLVQNLLFTNALSEPDRGKNPIANDIYLRYLRAGTPSSWTLITPLNRIQEPTQPAIKKAWAHLDEAFAPGKPAVSVKEALTPLLEPPFGYDLHHLALVFSAWFAFRKDRLKIFENGRPKQISDFYDNIEHGQLIEALCYIRTDVRIEQTDQHAEAKRIRTLLSHLRQNRVSAEEAKQAIADLRAAQGMTTVEQTVRDDAASMAAKLEEELPKLKTYEDIEQRILSTLREANTTLPKVYALYGEIKILPTMSYVSRGEALSPEQLREKIDRKIEDKITAGCKMYSVLANLEDHKEHERQLETLQKYASNSLIPGLSAKVLTAQQQLAQAKRDKENERADASLREYLNALKHQSFTAMPLKTLREVQKDVGQRKAYSPLCTNELTELTGKIATAISQKEQFVQGLTVRLDNTTESSSLREIRSQINRQFDTYEDTVEQETLKNANERAEKIATAFGLLDAAKNAFLATPQEAKERIQNLESEKNSLDSFLSPAQQSLFTKAISTVQAFVNSQTTAALQRLEDLEVRVATGTEKLTALKREVNAPLPFLPETESHRLEKIQAIVQERWDADEIEVIVARFQALTSLERRQQCFSRLQDLLNTM
jgi:hypothetical protein